MVLSFVRDFFADVEKLPAFSRVTSHLRANTGRIRVTGLTPPAKALLLAKFQKSAARPLIMVVRNNQEADELLPVVRAFSELVGGAAADSVVCLPTRDVLPFQNLSPHPEIQEQRAIALWRIATGSAEIVIVPALAAATRLHPADFYSGLGMIIRRGETVDTSALTAHLNSVGYKGVAYAFLVEVARNPSLRPALYHAVEIGTKDEKVYLARVLAVSGGAYSGELLAYKLPD